MVPDAFTWMDQTQGEVTEDGKRIAREKLAAIEAQMLARQQKEAERKANPPAPPVKKKRSPSQQSQSPRSSHSRQWWK